MATEAAESEHQPPAPLANRLGYLLKHAQMKLSERIEAAVGRCGIDGREWAVLLVLADQPASQREIGQRLGVDRTTMVAHLDALERKGLVQRRPDPADRRRNVIHVTATGQRTLRRATKAGDEAERQFLAALGEREAKQLKHALYVLVTTTVPPS